ncbi:MAG: NAD(P)H-hydrate epimerase, partial [Pseudolabrys sp.]
MRLPLFWCPFNVQSADFLAARSCAQVRAVAVIGRRPRTWDHRHMMELLSTAEMARADQLTIAAGTPGLVLMERAGAAVAERAMALRSHGRVLVLAGPGNIGGEGFVAARLLAAKGYAVTVLSLGGLPRAGDAAAAAQRWTGVTRTAQGGELPPCDLSVDALVGAGLARPLDGEAAALVKAANAAGVPILAVDLPSGIQGDTGATLGVAVRATETVTFARRKPGHLLLPGRLHCGRVRVADIGISAGTIATVAPSCFANEPALWLHALPVPAADGHKYSRGHVVVGSGGIASTGAGRLAARGALRAGAGLVTIASPPDALAVQAAANTAVMVRQIDGAGDLAVLLADRRVTVVVLGPGAGIGERLRAEVRAALASDAAVVLDADAITSFADEPEALAAAIAARQAPTVLTPHGGEFGRLVSHLSNFDKIIGKLEQMRSASRYFNAIVLLKGPDTVVADPRSLPDGRASIAAN